MDTVGARIKRIRELRGYTQIQVAKTAGINVVLLQQYEHDVKRPKEAQLQKIADALLVHIDFLRVPKVDSPDAIFALLFELMDAYGTFAVSQTDTGYAVNLPDDFNRGELRERMDALREAQEEYSPAELQQWLANYRYHHVCTVDFKKGLVESRYPELEVRHTPTDGNGEEN